MSSEAMREVLQIIDTKAQSRPTPMEFELAYQARVAMDRIRFAIKHTEQFASQTDQMQEAGLQLLDALDKIGIRGTQFPEPLPTKASNLVSLIARINKKRLQSPDNQSVTR